MTATIKAFEISESADLNPSHFKPDHAEDFICTFGLKIGPAGSDGAELFFVTVSTPTRLARLCEKDGYVWGRNHLVVPYFNLEKICSILNKFVDNCSGPTWEEISLKLARLGAWEFEDYHDPSTPTTSAP